MMDNAKWRQEQREKNVKKYKEQDEKETEQLKKSQEQNPSDAFLKYVHICHRFSFGYLV